MEGEDDDASKVKLYDMGKFKKVLDAQRSVPPPEGLRLFLARVKRGLDSVSGFLVTFLGMSTVFLAPVVVFIGALYGLFGFLASFVGVVGVLSLYARRRLGASMQFGTGNLKTSLFAQVLGCSLVLAVFYFVFVVLIKVKIP